MLLHQEYEANKAEGLSNGRWNGVVLIESPITVPVAADNTADDDDANMEEDDVIYPE